MIMLMHSQLPNIYVEADLIPICPFISFVDHYMISLSLWLIETFLFWTDFISLMVCIGVSVSDMSLCVFIELYVTQILKPVYDVNI